jgi:hypothetical protein
MNFWVTFLLAWTGLSILAGILIGNMIAFHAGADASVTSPRAAKVVGLTPSRQPVRAKRIPLHHPHRRARKRSAPTAA